MGRKVMHIGFGWESQKEITRRPRSRWEGNIKMDLREILWGGVDWTDPAQDRDQWKALVNTVRNLRVVPAVPQEGLNCLVMLRGSFKHKLNVAPS
jgi:hypothetical protein